MADLNKIVSFLEAELRTEEIKDYPGAVNGLQLENDGRVQTVISAVDASLAVIEEASQIPHSLLLVHHGLFWQGAKPLVGADFRKIRAAIQGELAIYSSHLPLDMHPRFGNNILFAEAIGLTKISPIMVEKGWATGVSGKWNGTRGDLILKVSAAVGRDVALCPGGTERIDSVAVITGGAGSQILKIATLGVDAFVTGEGPHWSFIEGEELGINILYAGHYATETFGVRKLGEIVAENFGIDHMFISRPGGL